MVDSTLHILRVPPLAFSGGEVGFGLLGGLLRVGEGNDMVHVGGASGESRGGRSMVLRRELRFRLQKLRLLLHESGVVHRGRRRS